MTLAKLFAEHIAHVQGIYEKALASLPKRANGPQIDAVLIHSGSEGVYFGDDLHIPFRCYGHFHHWLPVARPEQMVLVQPGKKPVYYQVVSPDFWYEQSVEMDSWWADAFEIVRLEKVAAVREHLPTSQHIAFLGENTALAANIGLPASLHNHKMLRDFLDFYRGMKTTYEVARMREANRLALISHQAAHQAFQNGGSEYDIHMTYLRANQLLEHDSPYTNIVALDQKAAVLHYQNKRRTSGSNSAVLLIDAGVRHYYYNSDLTRTYAKEGKGHPVFLSLLEKMGQLQFQLCQQVEVGKSYPDIHHAALDGVLDLLLEHEIVNGPRDLLREQRVPQLFFPHGVGHLLGIQVHDVGGYLIDDTGKVKPPQEKDRYLRLTRCLEVGMVCTIEPGLYFIPVLLGPQRDSDIGTHLNWDLIEALIPFGGIRIEDNVLVGENGPENLTRAAALVVPTKQWR